MEGKVSNTWREAGGYHAHRSLVNKQPIVQRVGTGVVESELALLSTCHPQGLPEGRFGEDYQAVQLPACGGYRSGAILWWPQVWDRFTEVQIHHLLTSDAYVNAAWCSDIL